MTTTERSQPLVIGTGYVLALVLPVIGFIVGLTQINRSRHGIRIVLISLLFVFLYIAALSAGGGTR